MKPTRILHLIDANIDTEYFRAIARHHDRDRFPVMIGSVAPTGALQEAMAELNTSTFSLDTRSRYQYLAAISRLKSLIKKENVAVVHAHCFDPTFIGWRAARGARVPLVFTRHHSDHNIRLGKKWHTRIDALCARHADQVMPVSEATRQIMINVERVPDNKLTVVYNGAEAMRAPVPETVERLRAELSLGDQPVLLMVGRLHEEKGHRYLFAALAELNRDRPPLTVLLAGDGPHRARIEDEARKCGVFEQVRFLGRRAEVPELIALSAFVVMPSLAESFGFAALEAMSLAKPVVAFATGGLPEVIGDGGLIVPFEDQTGLASAIKQLLDDPALGHRLGVAGQHRAERFSVRAMMDGYERVYQKVLNGG
jgi:glycosyltransferase involved in cell wall biosynthesis